MSEALWGVVIGAVVGVVAAVMTGVVAPLIAARHQRLRTREERLHAAIDASEKPLDDWSDTMRDIVLGLPVKAEDAAPLGKALVASLRAFRHVNDAGLQSGMAEATQKIYAAGAACASLVVSQMAQASSGDVVQGAARGVGEAELAVHLLWKRALTLADPPAWPRRIARVVVTWVSGPSPSPSSEPITRSLLDLRKIRLAVNAKPGPAPGGDG